MYYKRLQQRALRKLRTKPRTLLDLHVKDARRAVADTLMRELAMNVCGLDDPALTRMIQKCIDENI